MAKKRIKDVNRDRGFINWDTIESDLVRYGARTIPELRAKILVFLNDDKLWALLEAHHIAIIRARPFLEEASAQSWKILDEMNRGRGRILIHGDAPKKAKRGKRGKSAK